MDLGFLGDVLDDFVLKILVGEKVAELINQHRLFLISATMLIFIVLFKHHKNSSRQLPGGIRK